MFSLNPKYHKFVISCGVVFALLLITLLYLKNGEKSTQITFLYLIPILVAALYVGLKGSVLASTAASILFGTSTYLNSSGTIETAILVFDITIQFGAFISIALIISYIVINLREKQKEIDWHFNEFSMIQEINKVLPSTTNLSKMLEEILTVFIKNIPAAQKGIIALTEHDADLVKITSTYGIDRATVMDLKIKFGENHIGHAAEEQQPILIHDYYRKNLQKKSDNSYSNLIMEYGIKSVMVVPIVYLQQTLGVIALYNAKDIKAFTSRDIEMLEIVAEEIALAINTAKMHQSTKRDLVEHQLLYRIGLLLTSSEDLEQILDTIIDSALKITNTPAGSIALYDHAKQEFVLTFAKGFSEEFISNNRWQLRPGGLTSRIINKRAPLAIPDISQEKSLDNPTMLHEGIKSILATPLLSGDKIIGIIYIDDFICRDFTEGEISIMSLLANQATIAIDKAQMLKETKKLAITDGLTNCFNHRFFMNRLDEEVKRSERYQRPTSLIMIDLDFFKLYNDAYGHPQGDQALKKIAEILNRATRSTDIVARYGGDEFAIILPETSKQEAVNVAQKILSAIEEYPFPGKRALPNGTFTSSIGVAALPDDAKTVEGLVAAADDALYIAKKDKSQRVQVAKIVRPVR